jgi:hypothetical protein
MDALTLILCRKVADIDGWSGVDTITNVGALAAVVDGKGGVMGKALLFDLMVNYDVEIDYYHLECSIFRAGDDSCIARATIEFCRGQLPRAILECIIQANDL